MYFGPDSYAKTLMDFYQGLVTEYFGVMRKKLKENPGTLWTLVVPCLCSGSLWVTRGA